MSEPQPLATGDSTPAGGRDAPDRPDPMTLAANHAVAGALFHRRFRRWPLPANDPGSTINDFIFNRMIDPCWSPLQRAFVDKETAKIEARRLAPRLHVPETLMVLAMETVRSVDHLHALLRPFIGTDAVAKPAHASGGVTFLRDITSPEELRPLHDLASLDYASILREMQYHRLPRKIIVEAMIPPVAGTSLDDFKFHCVHGRPLICQVDHARFGATWSRLLRVPDFAPIDAADGLAPPETYRPPAPGRIDAMIAAARVLSAPFDFVRVDLYDGAHGVCFGELTFTPAASLGIAPSIEGSHRENATHRIYSQAMMRALGDVRDRNGTAAPHGTG